MHAALPALAAALAALSFLLPARAAPALSPVPGEVIVGFKPGSDTLRRHPIAERLAAAQAQQVLQQRAALLASRLGRPLVAGAAVGRGVMVLRAEGIDAATLARQLAADPDVAYAQPNGRKRRVAAPNDPLYPATVTGVRPSGPDSGQWYLRAPDATVRSAIDIEAAWARTRGSADVVVAVLDTGVRFEHPDLGRVASGGKLLPGYDFVGDPTVANDGDGRDADPSDPGDWVSGAEANRAPFDGCDASLSSWHGTATSSLIGAATDDARGMAGAAPGVRVLPVRVLGKCYGFDNDILAGMRWSAGLAVEGIPANPNPAKVLNLSLGGGGACGAAYQAAVDEITAAGVLVVAAAGNTAGGAVNEPANCRKVLGVVALRQVGSKVGFSDIGPEIGIAAPGGNCVNLSGPCLYPILAATDGGSFGPESSAWTDSFNVTVGTSFSSPLAAAVAALIASQRPGISPAEMTVAMKATAREFPLDGADNALGIPVRRCDQPNRFSPSDRNSFDLDTQCYCTTDLCGAGMLDAGSAVAAAANGVAFFQATASPLKPGVSVSLSGAGSFGDVGSTIASYAWRVVSSDPGVVSGFSGATNGSAATLLPLIAGSFTVELQVTDSAGTARTVRRTLTVAPPAAESSAGGGGGSVSAAWLAGLALAVAALSVLRRRA